MITQTPFVVVDLETTGLQPALDKIIEIAAVKVVNGQIVGEWDTLIDPGVFIPQESTNINGITTDMVQGQPFLEDVIDDYLNFLGADSVFVAHNTDFDSRFLNHHLIELGRPGMEHPRLCTFKLAKHVHPHLSGYGLGALAGWFNIDLPEAHRALHDARATAELFIKFMRTLQDGGAAQLKDIPVIENLPAEAKEISEGQVSLF